MDQILEFVAVRANSGPFGWLWTIEAKKEAAEFETNFVTPPLERQIFGSGARI